jgi:L-asparaginase
VTRVAVVFTGGTISMAFDPVARGNLPTLDGAAVLARTPGLEAIADVAAIDLGRTPASHFTFADLARIGGTVRDALADPGVDGAVVVQGTDTIEESAFFWDLVIESPKPVVVTGAMRTPGEPDDDGPANLRDAAACAAHPALRDAGTVVVLGGRVEPADTVIKAHATSLDAFRSLDHEPLGFVERGTVSVRSRGPRRRVPTDRTLDGVLLVTAVNGDDGTLVDAARAAGADGLVVAATGSGNTSAGLLAAATRAMADGIPVALTTRCPSGAVSPGYAFPGGGRTWLDAGALLCGHLSGPKARVALALGLGSGLGRAGLAALLADPVA